MPFQKLTALVVDDQELMRSVTVNQLRSMGWGKVLSAKNGADGLKLLRANRVEAVLSDWNMPVMNGVEFLRAVRAEPRWQRLPFLMITSETERGRIQDVITSGVSGLLVKPYNATALRDRLERALHHEPVAPRPAIQMSSAISAATEEGPDAATLPPTRLLVVDDNPTSLAVLNKLFADDYAVTTATGGLAALAACAQGAPPDLALMDVQMPDITGFEAVRRMRAKPELANIPVMFVTADDSDAARTEGLELGAVDFVPKTMSPKLLRQRVRNFLRIVDMRKQLQSEYDAMLENTRLREEVENLTRHDLKGSLSGIVGMVGSLAAEDDMPARHVDKLRLVADTAQQALHSVSLGGELYKMETGRFKLVAKPVPLGEVLRRVVELARASFADKHLSVVVDVDVPVGQPVPLAMGDEGLSQSLFQNLVKNACEAAPAHSTVTVTLKDEDPLRVEVLNTGTVPLAIRATFFDKYVTAGKERGSGLGTYSARLLAVSQRGRIDMRTSDQDNTTTLTVWLPRHPDEPLDLRSPALQA
jgi:CheY-like chemotaxis protein/nitrogen-specific signal transduction histidine kinase